MLLAALVSFSLLEKMPSAKLLRLRSQDNINVRELGCELSPETKTNSDTGNAQNNAPMITSSSSLSSNLMLKVAL